MDLFNWANDFLRGLSSGDSPEMRALLKELDLPRRTAENDSLDKENMLEGQARWLAKSFGWYVAEHRKSIASADAQSVSSGAFIDSWRRAHATADRSIVKAVVENFLSNYLSSCLDRPLRFAESEQPNVNHRSSNTVIDAFVRKVQKGSAVHYEAMVLLEVKNEQGHWEATARGRAGFFTSEEVAYLGIKAKVEKPSVCTFSSSEDTEPKVSHLRIIGFSSSDVPDYGMEIWNEAE